MIESESRRVKKDSYIIELIELKSKLTYPKDIRGSELTIASSVSE